MNIFDALLRLAGRARGPSRELVMQATSATIDEDGTLSLRLPESLLPLASPFAITSLTVIHGAAVLVESERAAFLRQLTHEARTFGWMGDYVEIRGFVENCHREAGVPLPDLEPYPVVD